MKGKEVVAMIQYYEFEEGRSESLDFAEDYENVDSSALLAGKYTQLAGSMYPMGSAVAPLLEDDR